MGMASKIVDRFYFDTIEDICWFVGASVGLIISCVSLFTFTLIIQHLHCLIDYQSLLHRPIIIEPPYTTLYSTLSAVFAALCAILIFSTYPVCTQLLCGYNALGNFYYISILDSYILAKFFLYFLFIGRLFNPHYRRVYEYNKCIKYAMFAVMAIVVINSIITNIGSCLNFSSHEIDIMIIVWCVIYVIADFLLSGCTLILFIRPLWTKQKMHAQRDSMQVVKKYVCISALQSVTATLYGISLIVRFALGWFHTDDMKGDSYLDICSLIQMADMLTTLICIYLGFAKKQTYQQYCEICEQWCFACCCCEYSLMVQDTPYLLDKEALKQRLKTSAVNTNTRTSINDTNASSTDTLLVTTAASVTVGGHR